MRNALLLAQREIMAYLRSPIGYVVGHSSSAVAGSCTIERILSAMKAHHSALACSLVRMST